MYYMMVGKWQVEKLRAGWCNIFSWSCIKNGVYFSCAKAEDLTRIWVVVPCL